MATKDTRAVQENAAAAAAAAAPERSSRFAYFGEDDDTPLEGGVHAVAPPKKTGAENAGSDARNENLKTRPHPAANGIPGPEERLLDISELVRNVGMHYRHKFRLPAGKEPDFEAATPIEGEISLTNSGAALLLRGHASTTLLMECGRCLTPTEVPVSAEIEEDFDLVSSHNAFRQEEVHAVDDDAPASVIKGNVLDLADLLRQNILLAAPLQPLCREDCPGIVVESKTPGRGKGKKKAAPSLVAEAPVTENPLHRLAEMLEAKRKSAENNPA